jgi:hypothetical protein
MPELCFSGHCRDLCPQKQELSREKFEPFPEPSNGIALHRLVYDVRFAESGNEFRQADNIKPA